MRPEQFSIHSYVFIPAWTNEGGRLAAERAASFGYRNLVVPLKDHSVINAASIGTFAAETGVRPITTSNLSPDKDVSSNSPDIRARGLDHQRASLRLTRDMGAERMGGVLYSALGRYDTAASSENFRYAADAIATLAQEAQEFGLKLTLEIVNRYETNLINTVEQAIRFLDIVSEPNVFLHLDTFHMNIEEADPVGALRRALPRLAYFEVDQNDRGIPDKGHIDFDPFLSVLAENDYREIIGVEAFSAGVSGKDVAASVSAWRDVFSSGDDVARAGMTLLERAFAPKPESF